MLFFLYPTVKSFLFVILLSLFSYHLFVMVMQSKSFSSYWQPEEIPFPKEIINVSIDPCANFYNFTCANFRNNEPLQKRITAIDDDLDHILATDEADTSPSFRNAQLLYRYCVSPTGDPPRAHSWFKEFMRQCQYHFSWIDLTLDARAVGVKYDFFMDVSTEFAYENREWTLRVSVPRSTEHIWSKRNRGKIATLLNYWRPVYTNSIEEIDRVIDFGLRLNQLFNESTYPTPGVALREPISALPPMESTAPRTNSWLPFLKNVTKLFSLTENDFVTYDFKEKQNVTYFEQLKSLMEIYEQRTWLDYVAIVIMEELCPFFHHDSPIGKACNFRRKSVQSACADIVTQDLRLVVEAEYLRRFVPKDAHEHVADMFDAIKERLKELLSESTGRAQQKKTAQASEMLDETNVLVGGVKVLYDRDQFEKFYGYKVHFENSSDGFEYHRRMNSLTQERLFHAYADQRVSSYFQKDDSGREFVMKTWKRHYSENDPRDAINPFSYPSLTLPATYSRTLKKLILPASILRWPVFDVRQPAYMNYAGLGSVIGETLLDSIYDVIESEFFIKEYRPMRDFLGYTSEPQCVERLVQFFSDNLNVPFPKTLNRRQLVSAFVGAQVAYDAFQERYEVWPEEPNKKEYQPIQLFWMWSRIRYCLSDEPDVPYRVVVPVANSPDFQEDFQCDANRPMNPPFKCRILV